MAIEKPFKPETFWEKIVFRSSFALGFLGIFALASLQNAPAGKQSAAAETPGLLARRYQEGEKLSYHMKGLNEDWRYEVQADGVVKRDSSGKYFEEYAWSHLVSGGTPVTLSPATSNFRQVVSLAPETSPSFPDLSQVDRRLIGPITDWMTFYADLWLANRLNKLSHPGDHFYFKRGTPNSWADGNHVLLGEDSIDFDLTLKDVNQTDKIATLLVRHVPPEKPEIKIPVEWMWSPVADSPNNWVQVEKKPDGKYLAEVGKETFDVQIKVSLANGKILSAKIDNPVETVSRECAGAALTNCTASVPHHILRQIEIY
jgi:hypothetical protein